MKKSIFILGAFAALTIASCSNNENKTENVNTENVEAVTETKAETDVEASIVGVWKLTEVDLGMMPPKGQEKTFDDLKADMIAKTVYTFSADGKISLVSPMGKSEGTYTLTGEKLTTVSNNKAESVLVQSMTANELVLANDDHGTKMVMKFQK